MGRQEWNREVERERGVLEHILALLLALAALADRAAGLPAAQRTRVLAFLWHGEAAARKLLIAMADESFSGSSPEVAEPPTSAVPDAALLAASLRVLALALAAILTQARGRSLQRHTRALAAFTGPKAGVPGRWRAVAALPAPDSS